MWTPLNTSRPSKSSIPIDSSAILALGVSADSFVNNLSLNLLPAKKAGSNSSTNAWSNFRNPRKNRISVAFALTLSRSILALAGITNCLVCILSLNAFVLLRISTNICV